MFIQRFRIGLSATSMLTLAACISISACSGLNSAVPHSVTQSASGLSGLGSPIKSHTANTWSFGCGSTLNGQAVSAGATRNWTLVVNDNDLSIAATQAFVNLVATINVNTDITFTDGLDSAAASTLTLPSSVLTPIQLNSAVFSQGI